MPPFIIVIDKKPFLPDTLEMIISNYFPDQFAILAFNNTTSAFNTIEELAVKKETIALIICDSQMPNLPGLEFLQLINTLSPTSTKVLSTTYIKLKVYKELLLNPIVDFILEKPFNSNSLINLIQCTIKHHSSLIHQQRNLDTIQSLKNSLSTLRSKYQSREQTLLTISHSLNSFYFRINLKNSLLDIYSVSSSIFGYEVAAFNDFDSFLAIVAPNDKDKVVESVKRIKVLIAKQDKIYFNIVTSDKEIVFVKSLLIAEEISNTRGTESIVGFIQNVSSEREEYKQILKQENQS